VLHVNGGTNWTQTSSLSYCGGAQDGTNYVMVEYGQGDNYLITPKLYPQAEDVLTFYMGIEGLYYNLDNLTTVEVSTTGTNPTNFTTIRTLTVADFTMEDNWYSFSVNLDAYAGQSIYIAFHNVITASGFLAGGNVYLDNVSGPNMAVASCTTPAGLATTNITASSANLTWTSDASNFIVYLRAVGESTYTEFTNASLDPFNNIYPMNGLEPGTTYEWYVASVCNDTFYSPVSTFTTSCVAYDPDLIPYFTTFDECTSFGELPNCWNRIEGTGTFPGAYSMAFYYASLGGDTMLRFTPDATESHWVAMPSFNEDIHLLRVRFDAKPYGTDSYYGSMEIGLLPNLSDTAQFEVVSTIVAANLPNSDFVSYTVPFNQTALSGNNRFVCFRCIGESGSIWYLDNVTLEYLPQCAEPTALTVNEVTATTASLSWTPGDSTQTDFVIHYKGQNDWLWQTENVTISDSAYAILSGLQHSTSYEVYVTAPCAPSSQTNHVTFLTTCMPMESDSLPYTTDFEDVTEYELPACWTLLQGHDFNYGIAPCAYGYNSAHSGNQSMRFYNNVNDSVNMVALPPIDEDIHLLRMNFWMRPGGNMTVYGRMEVGIISNLNDLSTFEVVETITASQLSDASYQLYSVPFDLTTADGSGNYIVFRQVIPATTSINGYAWYVDDITVELIPDCLEPSNLMWVGSTATTADLTWTPGDPTQTDFTLHYCALGSTVWDSLSVTVSSSYTATLTNLLPNTTYTANITADCAPGHPSQPVTFTTECAGITAADLPKTWDFENDNPAGTISNPLPLCWKRSPDEPYEYPYYPYVYSNSLYAYEGTKMLYFADEEGYAILPPLDDSLEINSLQLSFYARGNTDLISQTNYTSHFQVGVMTDPYDISTFSMVQAFSVTGENYVPVEVSFASYQGTGKYIVIKQLENNDYYGRGYIDLVTLGYISECERPYNLHADILSVGSSRLHWSSSAPQFTVYYKSEWDDYFNHISNVTDTFVVIPSSYGGYDCQWYVTANCADTNLASIPSSFSTPCDVTPYITILTPMEQAFDLVTVPLEVPQCWVRLSAFELNAAETYPAVDTFYERRSWNLLMAGFAATNLISMPIYSQHLEDYRLYFSAKAATAQSNNLEVGVMDYLSPNAEFHVIASLNAQDYLAELNEVTPYHPFVMDLDTAAYHSGWLVLRLICDDTTLSQWHLDDFKVAVIPECSEPLYLSVSNITANSVDLSWENGTDTVDLYYKNVNEDSLHVIYNVTLTDGVYNLSGLSGSAHYIWYVRSHCPLGGWSLQGEFATDCGVVTMLPYREGFEYGLGCWTSETVTGSNNWLAFYSPQYAFIGSSCAVFPFQVGHSARLISPVFDLSQYENISLGYSVNLHPYNNAYDSIGVYYRTSATADWTYLCSHTDNMGIDNYMTYTIPLPNPSSTYQVMFLGEGLDGNSIFLDNISVTGSTVIEPDTTDGINDLLLPTVNLFPNPAKHYVDVRVDGTVNIASIEVYDVCGKLVSFVVEANNFTPLQTRINVSGLANGLYLVRVNTSDGAVTKRFVKQ
jgi:hypothetical protein